MMEVKLSHDLKLRAFGAETHQGEHNITTGKIYRHVICKNAEVIVARRCKSFPHHR
jgi:hypothetical protein